MNPAIATNVQATIAFGAIAFLLVSLFARRLRVAHEFHSRTSRWHDKFLTIVLVVTALVSGINYFYLSRAHGSWLHRWDMFHTVMSARYFDELGYTGLYECSFVLDATTNQQYGDVKEIRDLKTRAYRTTKGLVDRSDCESRFTPARREAFVEDLQFWNSISPKGRWAKLFRDKGYNGTPFHMVLAKLCFTAGPLTQSRLTLVALADVVLILLAFLFVVRGFGIRVALVAFIFFCVCFPNRFIHMGGSAFRYSYLTTLVIGICMLRQQRFGTAGILLALSGLDRMLPFLFAFGVVVKAVYDSIMTQSIRVEYRRFCVGFLATCAIGVGISVIVNGVHAWPEFFDNMRTHNVATASYRVGFSHLFMFTGNLAELAGVAPLAVKSEQFRSLIVPYLLCVTGLMVALAVVVRRLDVWRFSIVLGVLALFLLFNLTRYYYSILVLLVLLPTGGPQRVWTRGSWLLLFLMTGVTYIANALTLSSAFVYNTVFSTLLLIYFLYLLSVLVFVDRGDGEIDPTESPPTILARNTWMTMTAAALMVLIGACAWLLTQHERNYRPPAAHASVPKPAYVFSDIDQKGFARFVSVVWSNGVVDDTSIRVAGLADSCLGAHLAYREGGVVREKSWTDGGKTIEVLTTAVQRLRQRVGTSDVTRRPTIEMCIVYSERPLDVRLGSLAVPEMHRGTIGLVLEHEEAMTRHTPTDMIATNMSFTQVFDEFATEQQLSRTDFRRGFVTARTFESVQILVMLGENSEAIVMTRGNRLVPIEEVTQENVRSTSRLLGDWLVRSVHDTGRINYMYWPSRGEESGTNNMIRQWMATVALNRLAKERGDSTLIDLTERNIRYNLKHFYREENGLGLIEWGGKVKLGAVALAALALVEHPKHGQFRDYEQALLRTIDHLYQKDGSFITHYRPEGLREQQNFYPGETLLLWATLYERSRDPEVLGKFMTSFRYYRDWHLKHRNPAFVPWHTQAYFKVWRLTQDDELMEFVFRMNDWLLGVQQWEDAAYPDTRGRFFDPARPQFGKPHASSTGVYMEGLIDAWVMANECGDAKRSETYRRAIVRGLRSLMQLQFVDDVDMFFVSDKKRVQGGVRATVYANTIRVDNVQHNLMATLKILESFDREEYHP